MFVGADHEAVFLGEARAYSYNRTLDVYNDPPNNTVPNVLPQIDIGMENNFPRENEAAEYGDTPIIKVNFH